MHINGLDCSIPFLEPDDLEEDNDTDDDRKMKAIFIDFTKLCFYIEGVLSLSNLNTSENHISICETTLRAWKSNLSAASQR